MKSLTLLFSIIQIIVFINCNDEEVDLDMKDLKIDTRVFSILPGYKVTSKSEIDEIAAKSDLTFLIFFYSKSSKNSYIATQFLANVYNKLEYLAGFITVDCDDSEDFDFCKKKYTEDAFPRLIAFVPPQYKINPYTKKEENYTEVAYSKNTITENDIYSFVTSNIKNKAIKLNDESYKSIIKHPKFNKVLLFTDKPQSGLIFKGLSSFFYDRILFCEIHNTQTDLIAKYKIKKYPTLVLVETLEADLETERENPEIHEYTRNLKTKDIADFISPFAHKEKLYLNKQNNGQSTDEYNKDKMVQSFIKKFSGETITENLDKLKEKRIMLLLSNDDDISEGSVLFARKTNGFFSFVRINCSENDSKYVCSKAKTIPSLLLLNEKNHPWSSRIDKAIVIKGKTYDDISSEVISEYSPEIIGLTNETFNANTFRTLNEEMKDRKSVV